jgi:hypothetical protein
MTHITKGYVLLFPRCSAQTSGRRMYSLTENEPPAVFLMCDARCGPQKDTLGRKVADEGENIESVASLRRPFGGACFCVPYIYNGATHPQ